MQARVQAKLVQEGFQPLDGTREVRRVLLRQKTILTPPTLNIKGFLKSYKYNTNSVTYGSTRIFYYMLDYYYF